MADDIAAWEWRHGNSNPGNYWCKRNGVTLIAKSTPNNAGKHGWALFGKGGVNIYGWRNARTFYDAKAAAERAAAALPAQEV